MEIVIATHNVHKIREIREILKHLLHLDLLSLLHFPFYSPSEEKGQTFEENAIQKAVEAANFLQKWVIADDSGLVVPSLNGNPGVYSRRYAGDEATDAENRQKILKELTGKIDLERAAYFECCIALANPDGLRKVVRATCEGMIAEQEKGRNGFGYDAIFIKNDYDKTFGEIDETTKNRISHRRKALEKLMPTLEALKK